jgi:hypothetical protein
LTGARHGWFAKTFLVSSVLISLGQVIGCGLSIVGTADPPSLEQTTSSAVPVDVAVEAGAAASSTCGQARCAASTEICCAGKDVMTCAEVDAGGCPLLFTDGGDAVPVAPAASHAFQCLDARTCPMGTACCVQWGVASFCAAGCPSNTTQLCQPKSDACGTGRSCEPLAGHLFLFSGVGRCVSSENEGDGS